MKVYFLLFVLVLFSCKYQNNQESLYLYYHGNRVFSFYDLVLKNDSNSYFRNLMYVGKPIEILIDEYELHNIKNSFSKDYLFINTTSYSKGLFIIYYLNGERKREYLFFDQKGVNDLKNSIDIHIKNTQKKKRIINWIHAIQKIHQFE
jgi:hypothetical protein